MKKKSQIAFSFAFLFLICSTLFSQQQWDNLKFRRFGFDQGLSVTTAFSIVQDDRGFLWIATIDGLQRYDGYEFVAFKNNFNDSTSLSDNTVSQLFHGKGNKIWTGTYSGGLNCLDVATGKFRRYQYKPSDPNSISSNRIWSIYEDKNGIVWIGTEKGLNRLDVKSGKVTRYFHKNEDPNSLCDDNILSIYRDKSGTLWIGTINGLSRAATDAGDNITSFTGYKTLSCDSTSLCGNIVMSFYEAKNGSMWIGTNDGLCRYNAESNSFTVKRFAPKADTNSRQVYSYLNSYGPNAVRSMYEDKYNNLWLATDVGLKIMNPSTGNYISYIAEPANAYALSADLLSALYEDRSGNLWIGTVVGGLNKADLKPQKFKVYQTQNGNIYNLSKSNIRALFCDSRNTVWAGTLEGGLNRLNAKTGKFEQLKNILHTGNVWAIYEDSKKQLWIGTSNGLYRYNDATGETGFYTHDKNDPQSLSNNIVRAIFEDSKGNLWIGTEGGLNKYDRHSETFSCFAHSDDDKNSLSHNTVWSIKEGPNALWVGTDNGLNKMITDEKGNLLLFKHYLPEQENKNSISNRSIRSMWVDNGLLWIGTSNGLNKFDITKETFTHYNEEDGLANSYIYGVLGDDKGNLWISTNNGISCFDKKTGEFHNYNKLDGLQNNEFNTGAYCKSLKGELFFGGPDGFNRFYPDSLYRNKVPPPIVLTSIRIFGAELPVEQQSMSRLTLRHDQNVISFEFSALDFTLPEKNRYEYMLEGFDKNWVKSDVRRFVTYTNLDPGNYKFKVRASNSDGTWNNEGLTLELTIVPPFWRTWWFRLIALTGLVLLVSLYIMRRITRLKKIQVLLHEQVMVKTKELREEKEVVEQQSRVIEKKNQNITSSIHYARRIQESILPIKEKLNEIVPESFIFFKPKDIVSGDFYWFTEQKGMALVAAADCTGHGVPGAFMSLIGNNLLNDIVKGQGIVDPAKILEKVHEGLLQALKKDEQESDTVDGMDITVCAIDCSRNLLEFSSTGRPLIMIRNNTVKKYKVGRHPLGLITKKELRFEKETIHIEKGDCFYIFTDGYCDQFGGEEDEKFMDSNLEKLLLDIQHENMEAQSQRIAHAIEKWRGRHPQIDDMLVIGIKC